LPRDGTIGFFNRYSEKSVENDNFHRHPYHWSTIIHYSPWGTLNHDFIEYVHSVIFFTKVQSCSTDWSIGIAYCHLLLPFSDPLRNYYQWSIFIHKTHRVYHKLYPIYTEKMDKFQSNISHILIIDITTELQGIYQGNFNLNYTEILCNAVLWWSYYLDKSIYIIHSKELVMHKQQFGDSCLACLFKEVNSNPLGLLIQLITVTVINKRNTRNNADLFRFLFIYFY
jgi:hypothetical protein